MKIPDGKAPGTLPGTLPGAPGPRSVEPAARPTILQPGQSVLFQVLRPGPEGELRVRINGQELTASVMKPLAPGTTGRAIVEDAGPPLRIRIDAPAKPAVAGPARMPVLLGKEPLRGELPAAALEQWNGRLAAALSSGTPPSPQFMREAIVLSRFLLSALVPQTAGKTPQASARKGMSGEGRTGGSATGSPASSGASSDGPAAASSGRPVPAPAGAKAPPASALPGAVLDPTSPPASRRPGATRAEAQGFPPAPLPPSPRPQSGAAGEFGSGRGVPVPPAARARLSAEAPRAPESPPAGGGRPSFAPPAGGPANASSHHAAPPLAKPGSIRVQAGGIPTTGPAPAPPDGAGTKGNAAPPLAESARVAPPEGHAEPAARGLRQAVPRTNRPEAGPDVASRPGRPPDAGPHRDHPPQGTSHDTPHDASQAGPPSSARPGHAEASREHVPAARPQPDAPDRRRAEGSDASGSRRPEAGPTAAAPGPERPSTTAAGQQAGGPAGAAAPRSPALPGAAAPGEKIPAHAGPPPPGGAPSTVDPQRPDASGRPANPPPLQAAVSADIAPKAGSIAPHAESSRFGEDIRANGPEHPAAVPAPSAATAPEPAGSEPPPPRSPGSEQPFWFFVPFPGERAPLLFPAYRENRRGEQQAGWRMFFRLPDVGAIAVRFRPDPGGWSILFEIEHDGMGDLLEAGVPDFSAALRDRGFPLHEVLVRRLRRGTAESEFGAMLSRDTGIPLFEERA